MRITLALSLQGPTRSSASLRAEIGCLEPVRKGVSGQRFKVPSSAFKVKKAASPLDRQIYRTTARRAMSRRDASFSRYLSGNKLPLDPPHTVRSYRRKDNRQLFAVGRHRVTQYQWAKCLFRTSSSSRLPLQHGGRAALLCCRAPSGLLHLCPIAHRHPPW